MKYAKLQDGILEFAPQNKGSVINYNTNVELMTSDGYKLFVEVERPETNRMYHINYNETSNKIREVIVYDETQEEADTREEQEEQYKIDSLTMTALDLVTYVKSLGTTDEEVEEYLSNNLAVKHQLGFCQNAYCGVVKQLAPLEIGSVTITAEMIEHAFKLKHGIESSL